MASIPYCTANGDNSGPSYSSPSAPEVHLIKKETKRLCVPNASLIYCIKNPICPHNRLQREEAKEIQEAFKLLIVEPSVACLKSAGHPILLGYWGALGKPVGDSGRHF